MHAPQVGDLFHADLSQLFEVLHPFFKSGFQLFTARFTPRFGLIHSRFGPIHSRFGLLKAQLALLKVTFEKRFQALKPPLDIGFHYGFQSIMSGSITPTRSRR